MASMDQSHTSVEESPQLQTALVPATVTPLPVGEETPLTVCLHSQLTVVKEQLTFSIPINAFQFGLLQTLLLRSGLLTDKLRNKALIILFIGSSRG